MKRITTTLYAETPTTLSLKINKYSEEFNLLIVQVTTLKVDSLGNYWVIVVFEELDNETN